MNPNVKQSGGVLTIGEKPLPKPTPAPTYNPDMTNQVASIHAPSADAPTPPSAGSFSLPPSLPQPSDPNTQASQQPAPLDQAPEQPAQAPTETDPPAPEESNEGEQTAKE